MGILFTTAVAGWGVLHMGILFTTAVAGWNVLHMGIRWRGPLASRLQTVPSGIRAQCLGCLLCSRAAALEVHFQLQFTQLATP
jgi:hypothetical protein